VYGGSGDDVVLGQSGTSILRGGTGRDTINSASSSSATIYADDDRERDRILCGPGRERVYVDANDVIDSGQCDEVIRAS
jgi:Ca2+-binding RTX toxin-like protein